MADDILQQEDPSVMAKFPWQRAVIILLSAIVALFGWFVKKNASDLDREAERSVNFRATIKELRLENHDLQDKVDKCNEGKAEFIMGLLNNELALKLSKDTSATSKLIISSLIKANEQIKSNQK